MSRVLLGLGANVGEPLANLREAISRLNDICLISRVSSLYRTEPVGYADQEWFLNCAVAAETSLSPHELLDRILRIEAAMGRVRSVPNGPRIIDIDLLLFDDLSIVGPPLTVPHPRMHERAFVLHPAAEIAPEWRHPALKTTIQKLSDGLDQRERIERINAPAWPPLATT